MTVPAQLQAFSPEYAEPVDVTSQVDRLPGTADADCLCGKDECAYPFCKPPDEEDE